MLLYDGRSCIDVDECLSLDNVENNKSVYKNITAPLQVCNGGQCRNTPGGFSCVCSGGLMMGPDASSCLDLDECIIEPEVCRSVQRLHQ